MLRDPSGLVIDPYRKHVTYVVSSGTLGIPDVPRDMSGEARLLLHEKLQQKTRFFVARKGGGGMALGRFPKKRMPNKCKDCTHCPRR